MPSSVAAAPGGASPTTTRARWTARARRTAHGRSKAHATWTTRAPWLGGLALLALAGSHACAHATRPPVEDMALAFAVRTALVNDDVVGAAPVEVSADDGVVTVAGRVAEAGERERIVSIVRGVPGVRTVRSEITLSSSPQDASLDSDPGRRALSALPLDEDVWGTRYFAAGGSFGLPFMRDDTLDGSTTLGPVFRFGRGAGWRPTMTLARVRAELPPVPGTDAFGDLRATVLAGGLAYAITTDRWSLTPSAAVGYSFNHIRLDPGFVVPLQTSVPVALEGSFAALPSVTTWFEASHRVSVGLTVGYLVSRPQASWLLGERFERRRLKADAVLTSVSVAYWIF